MLFRKVELYPSDEKPAPPKEGCITIKKERKGFNPSNILAPILEKDMDNITIKENLMKIFEDMVTRILNKNGYKRIEKTKLSKTLNKTIKKSKDKKTNKIKSSKIKKIATPKTISNWIYVK